MSHTSLRKHSQGPGVPYWYWLAIGMVALVGVVLIAYSALLRINVTGVTTEGDYFKGNPDAPVTIIDWGNFG